ncbi:ACP S-malonyltransferase [Nonomuraea longispora]|uniref:Malonyl CoA-acyl carrier protein transacylase n=1 Tax=Nonomuraea longispora TaxID=1848320 RepID=A0A4R4N9L2_9ACTN|nr:ACP S-malonyltransferase [Nonomuraea longispora]TDC04033.1 ACP S-malonyltransferase [Nonomuraea longispora]
MLACFFPGQGTLRVGMGRTFRRHPAAMAALAEAGDVLGRDLAALCARGPQPALISTENAQPAVTACNLAALAALRATGLEPDVVAGHSVGELSALHAAGVLDFAATLRLVEARGRLMARVRRAGVMSAVLGLTPAEAAELVALAGPGGSLAVAIENGPDHVVVSGSPDAMDRFGVLAMERGARKMTPLSVSHAFHSPLMSEVAGEWAERVAGERLRPPRCPVLLNATGLPATDAEELRRGLTAQLTGRVLWAGALRAAADLGVRDCVEVGDSRTLTGLARAAGLRCVSMSDPAWPRNVARLRPAGLADLAEPARPGPREAGAREAAGPREAGVR